MQGDIVGYLVYIVVACSLLNVAGDVPCSVDREIGVMTDNVHAEVTHGVCDHAADSAETDYTELFAGDLTACECALTLLDSLCNALGACERLCPRYTLDDAARSEQQRADGQLLNAVCVSSGSIENNSAVFRAARNRDVNNTCAGSWDSAKLVPEFRILKVCGADHDTYGRFDILADIVFVLIEHLDADRGDLIHQLYIFHDNSLSFFELMPWCSLRQNFS